MKQTPVNGVVVGKNGKISLSKSMAVDTKMAQKDKQITELKKQTFLLRQRLKEQSREKRKVIALSQEVMTIKELLKQKLRQKSREEEFPDYDSEQTWKLQKPSKTLARHHNKSNFMARPHQQIASPHSSFNTSRDPFLYFSILQNKSTKFDEQSSKKNSKPGDLSSHEQQYRYLDPVDEVKEMSPSLFYDRKMSISEASSKNIKSSKESVGQNNFELNQRKSAFLNHQSSFTT